MERMRLRAGASAGRISCADGSVHLRLGHALNLTIVATLVRGVRCGVMIYNHSLLEELPEDGVRELVRVDAEGDAPLWRVVSAVHVSAVLAPVHLQPRPQPQAMPSGTLALHPACAGTRGCAAGVESPCGLGWRGRVLWCLPVRFCPHSACGALCSQSTGQTACGAILTH